MSKKSWSEWDCYDWNKELFRYYFVVNGDNDDPVTSLCVTAEELQKVTGDIAADPEKVQESLLRFVRGSISGSDRKLKSGKGFEKRMRLSSKSTGHLDGLKIPSGFVYLIVSCLAANQVLEDEDTDSSQRTLNDFREVLAKLLDLDDVHITQDLAETWSDLAAFLDEGSISLEDGSTVRVRPLKLPDPGNETHIGYSKRLVFPSRRDQRKLAMLLTEKGVIEEHPPVDAVVTAVGGGTRDFSRSFIEAFEEFRSLLRTGEVLSNLLSHKFWSAVVSTCGNDVLTSVIHQTTYGILLDIEDGFPSFYLVANGQSILKKFEAIELDSSAVQGWQYRLAMTDDDSHAVAHVFRNSSGLGTLTSLINSGVIPLAQRVDFRFENVSYIRNEEVGSVLVRNDLLGNFKSLINNPSTTTLYGDVFEDWCLLENVKLRSYSDDELSKSAMQDVQVLRRRIFKPSFRVQSLFQLGNEYLGWPQLLPKIVAPGMDNVSMTVDGSEVSLIRAGDVWSIAPQKLFGSAIVVAEIAGQKLPRAFKFVDVPSSDTYLTPTDASGFMIEVNSGSESYQSYTQREATADISYIPDTVHRTYFGFNQGEFLSSPEGALVEISYFGEEVDVRLGDCETALKNLGELDDLRPENKGLKRKWRQRIHQIAEQEAQKRNLEVASMLRKLAHPNSRTGVKVSAVGSFSSPPTPYEDSTSSYELRKVLQAAVGARLLRTKGIPIRIWMSMIQDIFGVDNKTARLIHRGWLESGILDELISIRSPGAMVFARPPRLEVFESESGFFGGVSGLVMPERFEKLRILASEAKIKATNNIGPSQFVPPHLRIRSESLEELATFAQESRLQVHQIAPKPFGGDSAREYGRCPTRTYFARRNFPTFECQGDSQVSLFESMKGPLIWSVEDDSVKTWTYSSAHSEHLKMLINGVDNFEIKSAVDLSVRCSFIPLQAARWITMVAGVPSGPNQSGQYIYRFASPAMLQKFTTDFKSANEQLLKTWKEQ